MILEKAEGQSSSFFENGWLPNRPYAADDFESGIYQMSRERALTMKNIQVNPPALTNLLSVDIDHNDAVFRALHDRKDWRPNWVIENPSNGHAHAVWGIKEPVTRTEYARRKPLAFLTDVGEGLRRSTDADQSYGGFMVKNPIHEDWVTYEGPEQFYALTELAEHLRDAGFMPPHSWRRNRKAAPVGLGRNCTLFETVRTWAYPQINNHWGDPEGLGNAIELMALQVNVDEFEEPLPTAEVIACSRSISRWIVTKSRMWKDGKRASDQRFSERQSRRGRKGMESRWGETNQWEQRALEIIGKNA